MERKSDQHPRLSDCACRNLRMTARVITQYYDEVLRDSGLKSTQFALLNDIASRAEGICVGELAELSMMDQTTVTRNVEILRKKRLVSIQTDAADSRRKKVTLSQTGKDRLTAATPSWEEAQLKLQQALGNDRYMDLLELLRVLQTIK